MNIRETIRVLFQQSSSDTPVDLSCLTRSNGCRHNTFGECSLYIYIWETCAQPQGCLLHLILQFLFLLLLLHLLYLLILYLLVIAVEAVLLLFMSLFPYACTIKRFFFSFYSVNTSFFLISFVSSCLWMLLLLLFSFLFAATNCPFANGSTLSKNT